MVLMLEDSVIDRGNLGAVPKPSTQALEIRALARESDRAARRLIDRAAYMEKRALRAAADSRERRELSARAQDFRAEAAMLIAAASELSRKLGAS